MHFATLSDYLDAHREDPGLAFVPIPLVAEHLELSPATVRGMIKSGKLDQVLVGKNTFISAQSLVALHENRYDEFLKVKHFLETLARTGTSSIFYEPVMNEIGLTPRVPAHRAYIGKILGEVSKATHSEKNVLLSVIVHGKKLGKTRPGSGFFDLALNELKYQWTDDDEFVKAETERVLNAYA